MGFEYERVSTPAGGLRLHLNENTAGCSPKVLAALRQITGEQVAFYPEYDEVVDACARRLNVGPDQVLLTNGLDDGILAVSIAALRGSPVNEPFEAIIVVPAFDMYAACADAVGGRIVEVALGADFSFPLRAVLGAITSRTRLIFLTNPNNPTGQLIPRDAIIDVARAAPKAAIFLDEAYGDFAGDSFVHDEACARLPNIIAGRTFAKAYGLAGLRAGALVAAPETLALMKRVIPPYTLNSASAIALPVAFADEEYYRWYLDEVVQSKALLYEALDRLRVKYWRSEANFVLAAFGASCTTVVDGLAQRGIYIRDRSGDPGCEGCVRITAGIVEHTRQCIAAIEEVLCGAE